MKFKLNFDNFEELSEHIKKASDEIDEFDSDVTNELDELKDSAQSLAFDKAIDEAFELLERIRKTKVDLEKCEEKLTKYSEEQINNNDSTGNDYIVETEEVLEYLEDFDTSIEIEELLMTNKCTDEHENKLELAKEVREYNEKNPSDEYRKYMATGNRVNDIDDFERVIIKNYNVVEELIEDINKIGVELDYLGKPLKEVKDKIKEMEVIEEKHDDFSDTYFIEYPNF